MQTRTRPPDPTREVFILRLRRMPQVENWVAEVQQVRTGKVTHLARLYDLSAFLEHELNAAASAEPAPSTENKE